MEETLPVQSIETFLDFLKQYIELQIDEVVTAAAVLKRFISKQTDKNIRILNKSTVGTVLVCLVMITLKGFRENIHKNFLWANWFGMDLKALNESEISFLRLLDYQLWVQEEEYNNIYNDILKDEEIKSEELKIYISN
ncbi:MAG: hypothetical protein EZS28_056067 [Streblomastix strix]|uniref:Cyclin N-terminal domain-containing protein n=1 Tax=Streblomastix strix TaxID=222440 RepID=A0A5J4PTU4_9EUKA|nr:MAG: hypothetical protein EZS28_056067 [Streblomastix strix]